ncbi:FxSxx-COOH system tetratricopeptide repeat protein [Nonomuraea insulae]|uniref:FxSxx-COOH system tetratricopeptide repeat protein n=1 Tax=Nonomuraea insulae TaxID=1616787 RepID=A0ABW1DCK9_9ACTN
MTLSQSASTIRQSGKFPKVWGKIPPQNKNFTGREELLDRLRSGIMGEITAVVPHALHGFGGVGKTQMAVEYAYRFRSEYDVVWWVPSDQPDLVRSTLAQLAPHLDLPSATTTGAEDAANAVLGALQRGEPYSRWLLIFDNADEPEDINEVIPRGPGHVLITSRNHRWEGVVETVAVDVFTRSESVEFLKKRVRKAIDGEDASRLADELGDLPLALEQAGALQAETGMPVQQYLQLLAERTSQLLGEKKPTDYPVSMTAAWALSVAKLTENLPEAVELLRCCAFFGPEPIPREVFAPVDDDAIRPMIAEVVADPLRLSRAIGSLGRYALVRVDNTSRTIQVHRLIQALLRDELDAGTHKHIRAEVHALLAGAAADNPTDPVTWPRYLELLAHATSAGVAESRSPAVREFAIRLLRYLRASGNYASAQETAKRLVEQWGKDSGVNNVDVLRARSQLGSILRELGEYGDAYELDTATLEAMQREAGADHEETLVLVNGIGADLRAKGEFLMARNHDDDSLRRHEMVFGEGAPRTLQVVNSLALDYALISDYQAARRLHDRAYRAQRVPGMEITRVGMLGSMSGLARAVRLCGDYTEACDLGEDAYSYGMDQLGGEHPWTLRAAKELSVALRRAGEYGRSLEIAADVHTRYVRLFGIDHPDTLAAAISLSNIQRAIGDTDLAFDLASDTMHRYPKVYGGEHPYNHGCVGNLAVMHRVKGDPRAAQELNRKALAGFEAKLGKDHHYYLTVAANLASDLAALGDLEQACELGQETLSQARKVLGDSHPMTLGCAANLSADLRAIGRKDEGSALLEQTMDIYATTLTHEHLDVVAAGEGRHLDFDFDPPPI